MQNRLLQLQDFWDIRHGNEDDNMTTVTDVVEQLGGRTAVAEAIGCKYNAVSNWTVWGRFPMTRYFELKRLAASRGLEIDDALFQGRREKKEVT